MTSAGAGEPAEEHLNDNHNIDVFESFKKAPENTSEGYARYAHLLACRCVCVCVCVCVIFKYILREQKQGLQVGSLISTHVQLRA